MIKRIFGERRAQRVAIRVYILKKSIMKSSVDEYLELKAEIKEKKRLEKQMNPEKTLEEKQKKRWQCCIHWQINFWKEKIWRK